MPQESKKKTQQHTVRIEFLYPEGAAIAFVNATRFTHMGSDIIFDMGLIDDQQFLKVMTSPEKEKSVRAFVHYRVAMGIPALLQLQKNINEIVTKVRETLEGAVDVEKL